MADFFIVAKQSFKRHRTFEHAAAERDRLQALNPTGNFRLYRCKTTVKSNGNYEAVEAYVRAQAAAGCLEARKLVERIDAHQQAFAAPDPEAPTEVAA